MKWCQGKFRLHSSPKGGWALNRFPMAVVTVPNLPELMECLKDTLKTCGGILGAVLCGARSWTQWSMWVSPNSRHSVILWSKSSSMQEGFFFFTAQAGACQVLRHSCPVSLYPQMKEIHQQVGPQSQHCWDMNPLSSVIKREQIPVHPFTQDLTSRMLHGVDWANQTLRWNPRGGFAVGGFHRRLQLGERFNKPTKLLTLRNRTHPGETGWNTVALGKELLRDSYCQNFVLFII